MQHDNTRNTIIFIVCAVAILIGYQLLVLQPAAERRQAAARAAAEQTQTVAAEPGTTSDSGPTPQIVSEREALARSPRVPIETPALPGSVSLTGGRIDHLYLNDYAQTLHSDTNVELLRPEGVEHAYFAYTGWRGDNIANLPGPDTRWVLRSGERLAPGSPIVMTHDNGAGLTFTRTIAVDDQYLFTITDRVDNRSGQAVTLAPFGSVQRRGIPNDLGRQMIIHEGAIGVFDGQLHQAKYRDWEDEAEPESFTSRGGWVGITDKYWLTAFVPEQDERIQAQFRTAERGGVRVFETVFQSRPWTIEPGRSATETAHLFAGAKRNEVLEAYGERLGAPRLNDAIDWGMFWFLTKPIFMVLEWFYGLVGNFGVAILLLTIVVKLVLFPLANKAYASMSRMRNLQPKMEEIKAKHANDAAKQQQEIMALYQREKINPLAGCLPLLIQMPIFYALYKVLFVTIEMRHAPFALWIQDLSARDPTSIWTAFGLIPWNPASAPLIGGLLDGALHLGVLPIVYGLTMWLQQAMNPPAPDPTQRQIFAFLPFVFTFIMAPFAAGLILYWAWSNVLTIIQQYVIMHRYKAENPIDTFIDRYIKKKPA
ncbi:membrane protein insertase YidC [Brevundimonas sp.]|uniref:membrane protein insertase YidC n=1 Tax=Brevundimonas sp. TaxID=1871086 RepID=UPI0025FFB304|nr:membrane protein insertase YidC [Brevundimonas sp.]